MKFYIDFEATQYTVLKYQSALVNTKANLLK